MFLHLTPFLRFWERVVMDSLKFPARSLFIAPAPLLEEERDIVLPALVTDFHCPFLFHRPRMHPAFPSHDHPVDPFQVQLRQGADQWLAGKKPDGRRDFAQAVNPVSHRFVFYAHSHPDIFAPG